MNSSVQVQTCTTEVQWTDEADCRANLETHGATIGIRASLDHLSSDWMISPVDLGRLYSPKLIYDARPIIDPQCISILTFLAYSFCNIFQVEISLFYT